MRSKHLADSFRHAYDGLVHVLNTHRHARYLLVIVALVLVLGIALRLNAEDSALLVLAIGLVLTAELVNTAVEAVTDLATEQYHALARIAKDVAGAAVLVASITAALIGGIVFLSRWQEMRRLFYPGRHIDPPSLAMEVSFGLALLLVLVVLGKLYGGRGTPLRGGVISGHSALAFFLFGSIFFLSRSPLVSLLALLLALLVSQSRLDAGIHTAREVIFGALLALVVSALIFHFIH